jgi:hypothetical protein
LNWITHLFAIEVCSIATNWIGLVGQ